MKPKAGRKYGSIKLEKICVKIVPIRVPKNVLSKLQHKASINGQTFSAYAVDSMKEKKVEG